ncbi:MAG: methyl viologen-reducing hydrogenase [Candidatus Omnitrophota bacterium]
MKVKLSMEWLSVCGGCDVAMADLHENLLEVLTAVEICRWPVLMDTKEYPEADIGIISGGIRSSHDREAAEKMRKSCKSVIALGTCAIYGGISGAANAHTNEEIVETVYQRNDTTRNTGKIPDPAAGVPPLEKTVTPLDAVIDVDLYLPGCPPNAKYIFYALKELLGGRRPDTHYQTVCAECKRKMRKSEETQLKRFLGNAPDDTLCFLSQGYLCFGSTTLDRCGSPCPNKSMVCTGCAGPTVQILQEPNRDIRTELAERVSKLTKINKEDVITEIEQNAKTYYAYSMASDMIGKKNTFLIKKWLKQERE